VLGGRHQAAPRVWRADGSLCRGFGRGAGLARDLIGGCARRWATVYNIITAVGRGGNATLYGAFDKDGRKVAIKVLHPELTVSVAADRFLREIRWAPSWTTRTSRPARFGETNYLLWFVMPFVAERRSGRCAARAHAADRPRGPGRHEVLDALGTPTTTDSRIATSNRHMCSRRKRRRHSRRLRDRARDRQLGRRPGDAQRVRGRHREYMSPEHGRSPDIDGRTICTRWRRAVRGDRRAAAILRGDAAAVLDMQQHAAPPDLRKLRRDAPRALSDAR